MATKSFKAAVAYDSTEVVGLAIFTEAQIANLQFERIPALNPESTYVIERQWVHQERLTRPINGFTHANKVFVLEYNGGHITRVFCMGLSGLRATFFCKVDDNPDLLIEAYKDPSSKLWRGTQRAEEQVFGSSPDLPVKPHENHAYISRDFAFVFNGRELVHQPIFQRAGKAWELAHYTKDDKSYLQLQKKKVNFYTSVGLPSIDKGDLTADVAADLAKFQENLPQ